MHIALLTFPSRIRNSRLPTQFAATQWNWQIPMRRIWQPDRWQIYFYPLDNIVKQPLMLNHNYTTQGRLNERKNRQSVAGSHSFQGTPINWDAMWGDS